MLFVLKVRNLIDACIRQKKHTRPGVIREGFSKEVVLKLAKGKLVTEE